MSNEYKDWMRDTIEENRQLCSKYPFLIPRDWFSDQIPKNYDYSYTKLDSMPDGWRAAFGLKMCEEIAQVLRKGNHLEEYRIMEIKEKFGELRWYDSGAPKEVHDIVEKYRCISATLCITCGRPATRITKGWISPFTDDCVPRYKDGTSFSTVPIEMSFDNKSEEQ